MLSGRKGAGEGPPKPIPPGYGLGQKISMFARIAQEDKPMAISKKKLLDLMSNQLERSDIDAKTWADIMRAYARNEKMDSQSRQVNQQQEKGISILLVNDRPGVEPPSICRSLRA